MSDKGKIETTIGELVEAEPALARLAALRLDAKTRYHIVKLARLVNAETRDHFHEPRQGVIAEMGFEKLPAVPPAKVPDFLARIKPFTEVPVTIPWGPVTSTMLEPYPECTAADILALGPLCTMVEDPS